MGSDKKNHDYILIGDLFVNVSPNIVKLYYSLYKRAKSFTYFNRLARIPLPHYILRAIRTLQFTQEFYRMRKRYYNKDGIPMITSQHYGDCLVKLRQGEYKIFKLKKRL